MVEAVVQAAAASAKTRVRFKEVKASRGKVVRAEPVAVLYEQGRVHHVGAFPALEDQLIAFTTHGYMGDGSPDRVDAMIWGLSEVFPRVVSTASSSLTDYRQPRGGRDRPDSYLDGRNASERARARHQRGPIRATTHTRPR
jgi:Terminase RNaseH-like domain